MLCIIVARLLSVDLNLMNTSDPEIKAQLDYMVKNSGISSTGGVFYDKDSKDLGVHTQVGYVLGNNYQPALSYTLLKTDGGDKTQVINVADSKYIHGHSVKWQTDFTTLVSDVGSNSTTSYMGRTQIQFAF